MKKKLFESGDDSKAKKHQTNHFNEIQTETLIIR